VALVVMGVARLLDSQLAELEEPVSDERSTIVPIGSRPRRSPRSPLAPRPSPPRCHFPWRC
jgi:hypothetical protein